MIQFTKRNLLVFFRDKSSVFFSLLAVFMIIGLYALFLGDMWVNNLPNVPNARVLMNSWIMAGLLAVTSLTTTMGAFGTMVDDKVKKTIKDFQSSPLTKGAVAGGYIGGSYLIGVIMSLVALVLMELYIVSSGGHLMSVLTLLKVLGLVLLSTFTSTSMTFFLVSFFKSQNAFGTASTVIGTTIGFLTGIYLPMGMLPEAVQYVIKVFPISHAALLLRQVMMEAPLAEAFAGAPSEVVDGFREMMGVSMRFGGQEVSAMTSLLILFGTAVLFYVLSVWRVSKKG
ncbi:MAG: ABC transporter permease [Bacillota bacterium]